MPSRARIPVVGLLMTFSLSGCMLFPPWLFGDAPGEPMPIVVENVTDTDWVLAVESDFPSAFAIPAGETGTIAPWGSATAELVLTDTDCTEVDRLGWDGSAEALRITDEGLTTVDAPPAESSTAFAEFWDCMEGGLGGMAAPEPGTGIPGVTGSIAVISDGLEPFLVDVATAAVQPLEQESADGLAEIDGEHSWSPDGSRVAFTRSGQGSAIYLAEAAGGDAELLVEDAASPRWSPDGTRIAYLNVDPFAGGATLMVRDLETNESTELAPDASVPAWSPDGRRIAFYSAFAGDSAMEPPPGELRVVDADGSEVRTVAPASPFGYSPAWSPDGERIAFVALPAGADPSAFDIESVAAVHDLARDATTVVAAIDDATIGQPSWAPDGRTLAFSIQTAGFLSSGSAIGLVRDDGGDITRVAEADNAFPTNPLWSPDGDWLAFVRVGESDFRGSLVAIRADGSGETVVATGVMEATGWLELPDNRP